MALHDVLNLPLWCGPVSPTFPAHFAGLVPSNAMFVGGMRRGRLLVEPDVFETPAVVDAVGHQCQPLDPRLPAGGSGRVKEDRSNPGLGEQALDLPYDLFALYRV